MLFNILHIERPEILLKESYRILRPHGKLGIVHWNYDPTTPRGPSMNIRPKPEQCIAWAEGVGLINPKQYDLKPYHYGIVIERGKITNKEYKELSSTSKPTATRDLSDLIQKGIFILEGKGGVIIS